MKWPGLVYGDRGHLQSLPDDAAALHVYSYDIDSAYVERTMAYLRETTVKETLKKNLEIFGIA